MNQKNSSPTAEERLREVLADVAAKDPLTRKVYDSYMTFLAGIMDWGELHVFGAV